MPTAELHQDEIDGRWGWTVTIGDCQTGAFGFDTQEAAQADADAFIAAQGG